MDFGQIPTEERVWGAQKEQKAFTGDCTAMIKRDVLY
jgi:hypothetical protein